jgi:hypothetical protein
MKKWRRTKEAHHHLLHLEKKNDDKPLKSSSFFTLEEKNKEMTTSQGSSHHLLYVREKTKKWRQAKEARYHLLHLRKKDKWWWASLAKKNKQSKKKVDVHLLATNALVIFWRSVFFNTISETSSTAPLQHRFYNIIFYSIASTPLLQHCFLQQHFNITFITPSYATSFQLLNGNKL